MNAQWLLWLALALAAGVAEILTLSLVLAMVAGGAVVAAAVAAVTDSAVASVLAFAVSTGLLLAVVRPPLLRYSLKGGPSTTGVAALVGQQAQVTHEVSGDHGEVKLAGEIWTARAVDPDEVLETGSLALVERIDGATALVSAFRPGLDALPPPTVLHDPAALPGGENPTDRPES